MWSTASTRPTPTSSEVAVRPVVALPDHRLKVPSRPVGRIDDTARALAADLVDTMRSRPACVGLAAPQIGVGLRAFAIDVTGHRKARSCHGEVVLFDPEIVEAHSPVLAREGCLSVPDLTGAHIRLGPAGQLGFIAGQGVRREVRVVESFECGAIINPDHLKNQIEGAIVMAIGGALFETVEFENGKILNDRFSRYRVPRFSDVPKIEVVLLDRKDLPSAGAGETPIVGLAPAIGNAIFDATGQRLRALPLKLRGD